MPNENKKREMLTFQDGDQNTALHFAAKNGNVRMCDIIVDEAIRLDVIGLLVNCRNAEGFTPLILVALYGYHFEADKDASLDHRKHIVKKLLDAGANANYCKEETKMTALHWLSYNNDADAIAVLLSKDADNLIFSHDNNLPIDIAGTTPSLQSIDTLLTHYAASNKLTE